MTYQPLPPHPPADPRKSNRTLRIWLTVLGVVLVLCCLGGLTGGYFFFRNIQETTAPARNAAVAYLDELRAEHYAGAYEMLCTERRSATSRDEFIQTQTTKPRLVGYDIGNVAVTNRNGLVSGLVTVKLTEEPGGERTEALMMLREEGTWRVCP